MRNLKPCLAALLITWGTMYAPVSFAEKLNAGETSAVASSGSASSEPQKFADTSVDDLVAIAKAGQQNEAIDDAVFSNEAIRETIPGVSGSQSRDESDVATAEANTTATATPRQSTAPAVASNKLILNSPVVDQAGILSAQENQLLTQKLRHMYQQGLAQAAVVIVPTTNGQDIFDYGMRVVDKWQLGNADTDQGLLLLVAVNDRKMHIFTGYGLEGVLPDAVTKRIIDQDITPLFKQGDYGGGLVKGVNRIEERLLTDPAVLAQADAEAAKNNQRSQSSQSNSGEGSPSPIFLFIMALIFGSFITAIFGRFLGALLTTGGFFMGSLALGGGFFMTLIMAIFLWMFLMAKGGGGGRGGRGGGGVIFLPGGGFGGGSSGGGCGGGG
ncbi:MAG: TPM domain-containing protein [Psychrobacter sp.]|nr:TPM domain-containing protein [Psychrobacter sp.]